MDRRQFITTLAGTAAVSSLSARALAPHDPVNVIMITADDLGYGELSCYGQQKFQTPNIDRLAAQGIRFTDHYAGAPVCAPSRSSLMTGLNTGHTRVRSNFDPKHERSGLQKSDFTMAEFFQKAGYRTGLIGKWGLGENGTDGAPNAKGFDEFYGFIDQQEAHSHYPSVLWKDTTQFSVEGNQDGQRTAYAQELFTEEAERFIHENRSKPFFLFMAYTLPHAELAAPEEYVEKFRGKFPDPPGAPPSAKPGEPTSYEIFAAMVAKLDADVGRLVSLVDSLNLGHRTLIVFNSDNGPYNVDAGTRDPKYFQSAGPFRGEKSDVYEGGIRVPLIARWTGHIPAGKVDADPVAFWDYLPTFTDVIGVKLPVKVDGVSFLPDLLGHAEKHPPRYLYWEFNWNDIGWQAVRYGNWKAIRAGKDAPLQIYDLKTDPGEVHDVAASHPAVVVQVENYLKNARIESDSYPLYATYKRRKKDAPRE